MNKLIGLVIGLLLAVSVNAQTFKVQTLQGMDPTNAVSPSTGGSTFLGGMGIAQDLWVGGTIFGVGNLTALNVSGSVGGVAFNNLLAPYATLNSPTFTGTVTIPVGARIPKPDDVRNFGAVCNSPGSQIANNAAIATALATFHSAFIPHCGIYVTNLSLASGEKIYGDGLASALIGTGTLTPNGLINCVSCVGFAVTGLNIGLTSAQRTAGTSGVSCNGCQYVTITNNILQGNYGAVVYGSSYINISNNIVTAFGEGAGTNTSGGGIALQGTTNDGFGYPCGGTASNAATVIGNTISGSVQASGPPTPVGVSVCGAFDVVVQGNNISGPAYFGISVRGSSTARVTVTDNTVTNTVHEGFIVVGGASNVVLANNTFTSGAASVDYGMTLDGSQGTLTTIALKNNTIAQSYLSGITVADAVTQSSIVGNTIHNPNRSGISGQAGINSYGAANQFNQFGMNTIIAAGSTVGYGIYENADGTGTPSHNVYMSNSSVSMTTGAFSISGSSTSNNNIAFP